MKNFLSGSFILRFFFTSLILISSFVLIKDFPHGRTFASSVSSSVLPTEDFSLDVPTPLPEYTVIGQKSTQQSSDYTTSTGVLGQQTVKPSLAFSGYFSVLSRVSFFVVLILLAAILVEVLVVSGKLKKRIPAGAIPVATVPSTPSANSTLEPRGSSPVAQGPVGVPASTTLLNNLSSSTTPAGKTPSQIPPVAVSTPLIGLGPLPKKKIDKKTVGIALFILFLLVTIPLALFLVKQRQEIRKKAEVPAVCCEVWTANKCTGSGYNSFDMKVAEFSTEAQCQAYVQNPLPFEYTCNCNEVCETDYGNDPSQRCDDPNSPNYQKGKAKCRTSGTENFQVRIINQSACVVSTPTPQQPTTTPMPTPTVIVTSPTPTPVACYRPCTPGSTVCASLGSVNLVCADSNQGAGVPLYLCLNATCPGSSTCICVTPTPGGPTSTPTPTVSLTSTPIPTRTPTPTGIATPPPSATPTPAVGCGSKQCTTNADCPAEFPYCFDRPSDNVAIKVCVKNTSWYDGCETWACGEKRCTVGTVPSGCPSSYPVCASIAGKGEVCVINASWSNGCTSPIVQATPTIEVPPLPPASFEAPAIFSIVGGIILLLLGILL